MADAAENLDTDVTPDTTVETSALAQGDTTPIHERLPEKFRVFDGEGDKKVFNLESSAGKLLESYSHLEKKAGSGETPPESPEGYEIDGKAFGEEFNVEEFMADEGTQSFMKRMHAKGVTNSQMQEILEYGLKEWAPNLVGGNQSLNTDECVQHLKSEIWKTDSEYKENMTAANRAYRSLPKALQEQVNERIGNDPLFNQVMALFGKEMAEDTPPTEVTPEEGAKVEEMMQSEAYKDPKHPQHALVSKQVKAHFEKKFGTAPIA